MKFLSNKKFLITCLIILSLTFVGCIIFAVIQNSSNTTQPVATAPEKKISTTKPTQKEDYINNHIDILTNSNLPINISEQTLEPEITENTDNYTDEYLKYLELSEEEKNKLPVIPRKDEIPYEQLDKIIEDQKEDLGNKLPEENNNTPVVEPIIIPEKFDLNDKIEINIGNQKQYGLCWDFATTTCLETNLSLTQSKEYNFSEMYIDYVTSNLLTTKARGIHSAGIFENYIDYLSHEGKGLMLEDDIPLQDYNVAEYKTFPNKDTIKIDVSKIVSFPEYDSALFLEEQNNEEFSKYQNAIKTHIMNYGSLYATISTDGIIGSNLYTTSRDFNGISNHAISLVGWDDNYPKENFSSTTGLIPNNNGAYLALNSWGTDFGNNGYFYISYEDSLVHQNINGIISTEPAENLDLRTINNPALETYIKKEFNEYIIDDNYIKPIALSNKTAINLNNSNLTTLNGLEYFSNLEYLNLANNNISDVSCLATFPKLTSINLNNNPNCTGIENLFKLKNLNSLSIGNTNIKDVSFLSNLKKLSSLDLSNNSNVTGYEQISSLSSLNLSNCNIKVLPNLSNITYLCELDLSNNPNISNLGGLENCTIYNLNLSNCNLTDITDVCKILSIDTLNLSGNTQISSFDCLYLLPTLYYLDLSNCNITDAGVLPYNKSLNSLVLSNNKNITNLNKLTSVCGLTLSNCNLADVNWFSSTNTNLIALNLSDNDIRDIQNLYNSQLSELNLSGNKNIQISSINPNIYYLVLNNCNITDNFDFSMLPNKATVELKNNNFNYANVKDQINVSLLAIDSINAIDMPRDYTLMDCEVIKTIKVPSNTPFRIDMYEYSHVNLDYECSEKINIDGFNFIFKNGIASPTTLKLLSPHNNNLLSGTIVINIEIDNSIEPIDLNVYKIPNKNCFDITKPISKSDIKVEKYYGNGIYIKTNDYQVETFSALVNKTNYITVTSGNLTTFISSYCIDGSNNVTLNFTNKKFFYTYLNSLPSVPYEIINIDYNNYTVEFTNYLKTDLENGYSLRIKSSDIKYVECLYPINYISIDIFYDGTKITENDIEKLKHFTKAHDLLIFKQSSTTPEENIIVEQDYFIINFID